MTRRFDPDRRDRIIDAAIEIIAEDGVAGTSHRKVAARADVPLGSMTYHFESMDELLVEAFTRFATRIAAQFQARLAEATDTATAIDAVVELIHGDLQQASSDHVLTYELYTLAARRSEFRSINVAWMHASRDALGRFFPGDVGRVVDEYIEGSALHIAFDSEPQPRHLTRAALRALAAVL